MLSKKLILHYLAIMAVSLGLLSCKAGLTSTKRQDKLFRYFEKQAKQTIQEKAPNGMMPVVVDKGNKNWTNADIYNWRSGFWPGIAWYLFERTNDPFWKKEAESSSRKLSAVLDKPVANHDLGFQFYCSFGNGYRLTADTNYKNVLLRAADSLATLFNPKVGTILSWPGRNKEKGWPHNTIIDNMMNLELLFWASRNGGDKNLFDIAVKHARVTMANHFRPDYSTYHVLVYDDQSGKMIKGVTHQGFADGSMWARGQAWAIYGFTMAYRESHISDFLTTAIRAADVYLERSPADHIPFWDFNDPAIPNAPRDASAAAIVASALLELSGFCDDTALKTKYQKAAISMLDELASSAYLSGKKNHSFLLHSTGNKPASKDIDVPIIYADYYFLEALLRLSRVK